MSAVLVWKPRFSVPSAVIVKAVIWVRGGTVQNVRTPISVSIPTKRAFAEVAGAVKTVSVPFAIPAVFARIARYPRAVCTVPIAIPVF